MKYSIGSTQKPVASKFDFAAATEALTDSYLRLSDAYEQVVAAEGRVAEVEMAMDNCKSAVESIEKFGVTATTMAVFNGSNELDQILGLENLDLEAIESLGAAVKKVRKENYVSGLEGKLSEYWGKFVQFLKDLWAKIKRWFKELFDKNAKAVRIVNEAQKKGVFKYLPKDKKAKMLSPAQVSAALKAADAILDCVKAAAKASFPAPSAEVLKAAGLKLGEGNKIEKSEDYATVFEKKEISVGDWASQADGIAKTFAACAIGSKAKEAVSGVDKAFADAIKAAEDAAKADGASDEAKKAPGELAKTRKEDVSRANQYIDIYNTLVSVAANTMVTLANMGNKANPDLAK